METKRNLPQGAANLYLNYLKSERLISSMQLTTIQNRLKDGNKDSIFQRALSSEWYRIGGLYEDVKNYVLKFNLTVEETKIALELIDEFKRMQTFAFEIIKKFYAVDC